MLSADTNLDNPWKLALDGAGSGVWDWDIANGTQTHSELWETMLGFSGAEIQNSHAEFLARLHPDDMATFSSALEDHLQGRANIYTVDLRLRHKAGHWTWIHARGMVVSRDKNGVPLRMIGTHTDINERKNVESALLQQTELLRNTMGHISQGIYVFDSDLRLISFNARACEMLDLPVAFLESKPTEYELFNFQNQRGDFGPQGNLVEEQAREAVMSVAGATAPSAYLRTTVSGKTLEIKSHALPHGGLVRTFTDVSEYVKTQAARDRLGALLTATQALAQVGGWEVDATTDQVFWTEGVYRIFETAPERYQPTTAMATAERFFTPQSMVVLRNAYYDSDNQPTSHNLELEAITDTGRRIWVRSAGNSKWVGGQLISWTSVIQNITERKQASAALLETESRWKLAMESTGDGVWDWHIPSGVEFYSRRLLEMFGYEEGELRNNPAELDSRTHPDDIAQLEMDRKAHFSGKTPTYLNEHRVRCRDGSWKWVLSRGMVISRDNKGRPLRMIGTHTDITERKNSEALIRQQAFFDTLTGLPNRRMLRDRLEQEIKKCKRDAQQIAILFMDLDHFKEVNDTLGHGSGDQLLVEAARRLKSCVRESDTVARMGGDEFTIILTEITDSDRLQPVLQKLLRAVDAVFQLGEEQVFVSASIGVTLYPLDGTEIEDLFKNADQALYVAKGEGRNRFSFFTPALQESAQTRVRLATDLRTALGDAQFRVAYQPIVELATGSIHKAEALIRWEHPKRGLVSPAQFIPIAESSGLIVDIGEWVFRQAAEQVRHWRKALAPNFQISVNRSPVQFQHEDSGQASWGLQLQAMGLPGESVVVEITEGLLLDTNAVVGDQLLEMSDAGIQVSLDDFGTGYSSLAYLQKFDIDYIKIDQSFVRYLIPDSTDLALCRAIIVMAHALGMKVIAEGVETEQQRDLLRNVGCDYGQGYFFARPMPAIEFEAMYKRLHRPSSQHSDEGAPA